MKNKLTPYYCDKALVHVVLPSDDLRTDETKEWLIIGYPGVDGIEFRTKVNEADSEIFAFYPIEREYVKVAVSVVDLIEKWKSGQVIL